MTIRIALLRGVNVGGHNKLAMAEFRALLTGLGFAGVATYIQSGNAVFRAAGLALDLGDAIGAAISRGYGFEPDVMMLTLQELTDALAANPFAQAEADPASLHLFFSTLPLDRADMPAMQRAATSGEEFRLIGRVFYLYTPNGMGRSVLGQKLPRLIGTSVTGRNLRSCQRIHALAQGLTKGLEQGSE